jgi:hypothetical protein
MSRTSGPWIFSSRIALPVRIVETSMLAWTELSLRSGVIVTVPVGPVAIPRARATVKCSTLKVTNEWAESMVQVPASGKVVDGAPACCWDIVVPPGFGFDGEPTPEA